MNSISSVAERFNMDQKSTREWRRKQNELRQQVTAKDGTGDDQISCFKPTESIVTKRMKTSQKMVATTSKKKKKLAFQKKAS
uniref:Uncharacterized protein n=1 Tax=Ditylenchus dipsaci TaxID=166011 RepID=A0A915ENA5_9BILA